MSKRRRRVTIEHVQVVVIGVDHVGAVLVPQICRLLNVNHEFYSVNRATMLLVDPLNANTVAQKCRQECGLVEFVTRQVKATSESAPDLIPEGAVVFCCDQRRSTARAVSYCCGTRRDVTAVLGGCSGDNGAVDVFDRRNGENVTPPFVNEFNKHLLKPDDEEVERQFVVTNVAVASLMLNVLHGFLTGRLEDYDKAYVNVTMQSVRPLKFPVKRK